MPTLRDYRGRQAEPGAQLASELGASALALLQFLVERGDQDLQTKILEQNLVLSRQSSDLNRQALERGQIDLQKSLEELAGLKTGRGLTGAQEAIAPRIAERQATDLTMSQRTRQVREALEGVLDPATATERDGSVYGPALEYAEAKAMSGDGQTIPGGQTMGGVSAEGLREARTRLLHGYLRDVEGHARQIRDLARDQQAEMRRMDPDAARPDEEISAEVNRVVKRAFDEVVGADIEMEADALELLLLESENEEDSPLAGVASEALGDPQIRAAYEAGRGEIVRRRDIATGGGLASFLSAEYGAKVPENIRDLADTPREKAALEKLQSGKQERGSEMLDLILRGEDVLEETGEQFGRPGKPGGIRFRPRLTYSGGAEPRNFDFLEQRSTERFGVTPQQKSQALDTLWMELLGETPAPAGMGESLRSRSSIEGAPAAAPEQSGEIRGLADYAGDALGAAGGAVEMMGAIPGGARGVAGQGADAAQNAAFQAGLTAGLQAALEHLVGAPAGPAAPGAPAPIPGISPQPQSALPPGPMGAAMRALGAAPGMMGRPGGAISPAGPQRASPADLQLLQMLLLGTPPQVP